MLKAYSIASRKAYFLWPLTACLGKVILLCGGAAALAALSGAAIAHSECQSSIDTGDVWSTYVKQSVGAIGAILAALVTGIIGFRKLREEVRVATRGKLFETLIEERAYREDIERFLSALKKRDFDAAGKMFDNEPLFFYFSVLNPEIDSHLKAVIQKKDSDLVKQYLKQLLRA